MILQFKNWEKYNTRRGGIKTPVWFAFSHNFFTDPVIMELSDQEKLALIFLLCEASQHNQNGMFVLSPTKFVRLTGIKYTTVEDLIAKLLNLNILAASRTQAERNTFSTLQDKRREEKEICVNPDGSTRLLNGFDFEMIYKAYPRRLGNMGKAQGLTYLQKKIKSESEFQKALAAARNYAADCAANKKIGTEYVAQFSTFFGQKNLWIEWVDRAETKKQIIIKKGIDNE